MCSPVRDAVDRLNEVLAIADAIGKAFDQVMPEAASSPAWVSVSRNQVEAICKASEALEVLLMKGGA